MTAIYSSSALKTRQREVKDAALKDVVHITENGNGAFVFCSESVFEQRIRQAVDEALYAERVARVIECGREQIEAGECLDGIEALRERLAGSRVLNG